MNVIFINHVKNFSKGKAGILERAKVGFSLDHFFMSKKPLDVQKVPP